MLNKEWKKKTALAYLSLELRDEMKAKYPREWIEYYIFVMFGA